MLGWHFTDLRLTIDSRHGRVGMAFPASILFHFYNYLNFCEIPDIIYRKGEILPQKGNIRTDIGNIRTDMRNNRPDMRKIRTVIDNIRKEIRNNLTEMVHYRPVTGNFRLRLSNLRLLKKNILKETHPSQLGAGYPFSKLSFIHAIHPRRVLYRCKPGFQVLKIITSARLASTISINN